MEQGDISNLGQFKQNTTSQVNKLDSVKNQSEQLAGQAFYSNSTIQKSNAEAIVLTYAAGLPVLQAPPKTQVKNSYESIAYSVGGSVHSGGLSLPADAQTQRPIHITSSKGNEIDTKDSYTSLDDVLRYVKNLLALIVREAGQEVQDLSRENESLRLMLSTMALEILYLSVYGGMSGEEFSSLFANNAAVNEEISPLVNQLVAFIKAHLPSDSDARQAAMAHLVESVDSHPSLASLFQKTRLLAQKLSQTVLRDDQTSLDSIDTFVENFAQSEQIKNTIIQSIWQTYSNNFAEFAGRMQGSDIEAWMESVNIAGTKSPTEYYAFILAQSLRRSGGGQNTLIEKFTQGFNEWVTEPNQHVSSHQNVLEEYPHSTFIMGCMACGIDVVREAIDNATGIFHQQLKESPVADVLFAVAPSLALSPDYQAAAALIVALLNNGAVYKATEDALRKGKREGEPPKDLDFAIKYARQIIAIVTYRRLPSVFQNGEIIERDRLVRLMLTVMALNMLYRAAYGGMTGEEFGAILKGETSDIHEKIKTLIEQLASLVKDNLPESTQHRENTIVSLMDYVDSKDSIDSMLQSTRVLASMLSTKNLDQQRWEAQSN